MFFYVLIHWTNLLYRRKKKKALKYREKVVFVENLEVENSLIVSANKREEKWGKEAS